MLGDRDTVNQRFTTKCSFLFFFIASLAYMCYLFFYICVIVKLKIKIMKLSLLRDEFNLENAEIISALVNLSSRNPERMVKGHNFFSNMILNLTIDTSSVRQEVLDNPENPVSNTQEKNDVLIDTIDSSVRNILANSFIDIDCTALSKEDFEGKNDHEAAEVIVKNADRVNLYLIVG